MREIILITIRDFEMSLKDTEWWNYKKRYHLQKQIEIHKGLLNKL
jgi:hypothetical protein